MSKPHTGFLLSVFLGLFLSTLLAGGIAVSLAVQAYNEPAVFALN